MYRIGGDRRMAQSRELIYRALVALMAERPYPQITVKALAERAQVGRATFYRSFDTIDDVLRCAFDTAFAGLVPYVTERYRLAAGAQDRSDIPFLIWPFLEYWDEHSTVIELLLRANLVEMLSDALRRMLEGLFAGVDANQPAIREHFDYFVAVRQGVALNVLLQWIRNGKDIPPQALAEVIVQQVLQVRQVRPLARLAARAPAPGEERNP